MLSKKFTPVFFTVRFDFSDSPTPNLVKISLVVCGGRVATVIQIDRQTDASDLT